jgi:hypothetical protein
MDSKYKIRIHKNLVKEAIDKNFDVILSHVEDMEDKDVHLNEAGATIKDLKMRIKPKSGEWSKIESDLFFDQG